MLFLMPNFFYLHMLLLMPNLHMLFLSFSDEYENILMMQYLKIILLLASCLYFM